MGERRIDIDRARGDAKALLRAAQEGRAEEVYRLLEAGAAPSARDPESGGTALHLAAARGSLDVIDYLVGWVPVDKHARDRAGRTALGACVEGTADPVVIRVLVSVGLAPERWMLDRVSDELAQWLADRLERPRERCRLPARFAEAACSADAALFRAIASSPLAETRPVGADGFAVVTGQWNNTRNGVVCSRLHDQDEDEQIASVLDWLRQRRAPAQWLVAPESVPPNLGELLQRAGCRPERSAVHMAALLANLDLSPKRQPADLEIAAIHEERSLAAALEDPVDARLLASLGLGDAAPLRNYAAILGGRTVGVATMVLDGAVLDIIELTVEAKQRRRGIGRALVLHALREGAAAGRTTVTIAPTPAAVTFYEGLGLVLERYPPDRCYYTPCN